ncbi:MULTISPECIES: hypothetical protein [unclassified Micromonospora]|uniref:hypothetical protein n=1 Tax=unclassified Micromonospora TaxID=2617518 RepID=UPI001890557A|nr:MULTISPECIES: hypothetical protein [unclassified Micromonospora]MBF5031792.1 hypothetical protein [Micromonospora sp. ANENR4]WBC05860.1 hypothetical protein O7546_13115 [Micromonospora sp. WMMA1976]
MRGNGTVGAPAGQVAAGQRSSARCCSPSAATGTPLVGVGATVSPAPSVEQRRRLEEYTARAEPVPDLASWWEVPARAGVTVR